MFHTGITSTNFKYMTYMFLNYIDNKIKLEVFFKQLLLYWFLKWFLDWCFVKIYLQLLNYLSTHNCCILLIKVFNFSIKLHWCYTPWWLFHLKLSLYLYVWKGTPANDQYMIYLLVTLRNYRYSARTTGRQIYLVWHKNI